MKSSDYLHDLEWINKDNRLPDFTEEYSSIRATGEVFLKKGNKIYIGWFKEFKTNKTIISEGSGFVPDDATHWLPLSILLDLPAK